MDRYHSVFYSLLYFGLTCAHMYSESTVNAVPQVHLSLDTEPPLTYRLEPLEHLEVYASSMDAADEVPDHDPQHCHELLNHFSQRSSQFVHCAALAARPLRLCERCYLPYRDFSTVYGIIEQDNTSCGMSILRSDQLQVVFHIASFLRDLWFRSKCEACLVNETRGNETHSFLAPWTISFLNQLNRTRMCFNSSGHEQYEGNSSNVCTNCSHEYSNLGDLYTLLDTNHSLCMDLRDAMNITRREWSKTFGCTVPMYDTMPVIFISLFLCFLPAIFYLSSFLHSKQKTRRLIMPKRFRPTGGDAMFEER
uniref:osteopetrosis-associated transmembrane protein 1 n=1 Tax=Myxine glutinosa TaxID=7769 RepID=UPI00358FC9E7